MKIRNLISSAAIAIVLGFSGGSAFADSNENFDSKNGFVASPDDHYSGKVFVYQNDTDIDEGEIMTHDHPEASLLSSADQEILKSGG